MLYNPPSGSIDPNAPYVGKNLAAGTQGSKVPRLAIEATQREIVNAILQSGQSPTNDDLSQLWKAIQKAAVTAAPAAALWHIGDDISPVASQIVATVAPAITEYGRFQYRIRVALDCAGPTTINLNNLGARQVVKSGGAPLAAKDYRAGDEIDLADDGNRLQVVGLTRSDVIALTPAGAASAFVFTPGIAFADFTGGATDSFNGPFTVVQSLTIPSGSTYAVIDAVAAFRVMTAGGEDCRTRLRYTPQGGSPVTSTKYQGVHPAAGNQIPSPISLTLQNLNTTKSTLIELLVDSGKTNAVVPVYDPRIDVQYG